MKNSLLILALFAGAVASSTLTAAEKPNLIFILSDDLAQGDLGCYGQKLIQTPNLDQLAKTGLELQEFYVQPMCTPTRAALLTGRYPFRYGLQTAVIPSVSTYGLDTNEWLMPQRAPAHSHQSRIFLAKLSLNKPS